MSKIEAMTDKDRLPAMSFRPSRRQIITGMAALGTIATMPVRSAFAQKRVVIPEGEFTPLPIAIPNFVAGTPGDAEVGVGVAQVITNNLRRSGLFAPIEIRDRDRLRRKLTFGNHDLLWRLRKCAANRRGRDRAKRGYSGNDLPAARAERHGRQPIFVSHRFNLTHV